MEQHWSPEVGPHRSHLNSKGRGKRRTSDTDGHAMWSRHACSDSAPTSDANNNSELDETMSAANPKIEVAQIMGHFLSARHQCC